MRDRVREHSTRPKGTLNFCRLTCFLQIPFKNICIWFENNPYVAPPTCLTENHQLDNVCGDEGGGGGLIRKSFWCIEHLTKVSKSLTTVWVVGSLLWRQPWCQALWSFHPQFFKLPVFHKNCISWKRKEKKHSHTHRRKHLSPLQLVSAAQIIAVSSNQLYYCGHRSRTFGF